MNLSQTLQTLVIQLGIKKKEFCARIEISEQYFSFIKTGKLRTISQKTLDKIEKEFGYVLVIDYKFIKKEKPENE